MLNRRIDLKLAAGGIEIPAMKIVERVKPPGIRLYALLVVETGKLASKSDGKPLFLSGKEEAKTVRDQIKAQLNIKCKVVLGPDHRRVFKGKGGLYEQH